MSESAPRPVGGARASHSLPLPEPELIEELTGVILSDDANHHSIKISPTDGVIEAIEAITASKHTQIPASKSPFAAGGLLALPSLCHPHLHLDKPHLLTHPATSHLRPINGDFVEALSLTARAKPLYKYESVLERMHTLLADSSRAGVTHIRGIAEVDTSVQMIALDAALAAKRAWETRLQVQVCAFAQDPVFSGTLGSENRMLMEAAVRRQGVEVLGSTPYVESSSENSRANVQWAVRTAIASMLHLDLHLDYNDDSSTEPLIWWVLEVLRSEHWTERMPGKTVCLGHCTRFTLFSDEEWKRLQKEVRGLPVYFVGLPTSDLFMMDRHAPSGESDSAQQTLANLRDLGRRTLRIPAMIAAGFDACMGVNNVGNAFTPYGSADPLALAQLCVGVYQAATIEEAELLYECVSWRAKQAIGVIGTQTRSLEKGSPADIVLLGRPYDDEPWAYRRRKATSEVVWDAGNDRKTVLSGKWVRIE